MVYSSFFLGVLSNADHLFTLRAASGEGPTTAEQLAIDSEADGTVAGWEKEEEKRQKDENWAEYTDANPKGAGNTMNRG